MPACAGEAERSWHSSGSSSGKAPTFANTCESVGRGPMTHSQSGDEVRRSRGRITPSQIAELPAVRIPSRSGFHQRIAKIRRSVDCGTKQSMSMSVKEFSAPTAACNWIHTLASAVPQTLLPQSFIHLLIYTIILLFDLMRH